MVRYLFACILLFMFFSKHAHAASFFVNDLESKDVIGLSVTEKTTGNSCDVHIEGLVAHSAMAVNNTSIKINGSVVEVSVELALSKSDKSGKFDITVPIESKFTEVQFAKDQLVVWRRENSKCLPPH